jgi:cation transport protein ChaC
LFRVPADQARTELPLPFRRELFTYSYDPRWLSVATLEGTIRAVTFVVNRDGARYVQHLDLELIAHLIATAYGVLGSSMEYVRRTLESLEALGLDDRMPREVYRLSAARATANETC